MRRGEVTPPYGCNTGGAQQRADVPKAWLPPTKFRAEIWGVSHGHRPLRPAGDEGRHAGASCPTGGCGEPPRLPWPAAHSGASAARSRRMGGNRGRDHPQKGPATPDNPSVTAFGRDSSLCTREPLGTGDADCRVASLLAMTVLNLCHSEEAQRADVGIRPFYDGRWFGPPRSSAPTEGLPKSQQRADVGIGPYGKPNQPPKPAGAQRSVRARVGEGWAGIGAKAIPKGGLPRDCRGSA